MIALTAQNVFENMAPSTLVDFISNLPDDLHPNCVDCAVIAELNAMAYQELVANVGQQEADDLLMEWEPC